MKYDGSKPNIISGYPKENSHKITPKFEDGCITLNEFISGEEK